MSQDRWTEDFLNEKRKLADPLYDARAAEILDATFLQDANENLFLDWIAAQEALLAELAKGDDRARLEKLCAQQGQQYFKLGTWRVHMWPPDFQFHIDSARLATLLARKALANYEPASARAAMECALTGARWLAARLPELKKDPEARKRLAKDTTEAYYRLLQLAEEVRRAPGLFLCDGAYRKAQFKSYPDTLHDSFTPPPCPTWVDEEKVRAGFRIWQEYMPQCIFVLFTHSLPACYLDRAGIPLLYRTERLEDQNYLAQRMYETGFFVRDVLDRGVTVLEDEGALHTACFAAAVHEVRPTLRLDLGAGLDPVWTDPAGGERLTYWELRKDAAIQEKYAALKKRYADDPGAFRSDFSPADLGCESYERLFRHSLEPDLDFTVRRLWGQGILTATKVRYLHASMRFMSRDDPRVIGETNGQPINQEDKMFTLLTICYVIPVGLAKMGANLSVEEKEAFLHCWKVIGHVMGVDEDLLTDKWDEAEALYELIKKRQGKESDQGKKLTRALCILIQEMMPTWLPFRDAVGPVWVRDQLGEKDADKIFDPDAKKASRNICVRLAWALAKLLLRFYFISRRFLFDLVPAARRVFSRQLHSLGSGMIECFQQTYERQRFEFFSGERGIQGNSRTTPEALAARLKVRRRVYTLASLGVILIVLFHPLFWASAVLLGAALFTGTAWLKIAALSAAGLCVLDFAGVELVEKEMRAVLRDLDFRPPSRMPV